MTIATRFAVTTILVALISNAALAQTAPVNPFDQEDPEIAAIKKLDWKGTDFDSLDPKSKCLALMALNKGLSQMGAKADARVDLLVDYIDQHNLGHTYASAKSTIPDPPQITFEQMERVAAAYAKTPTGSARLANELPGGNDDMLNRYLALYEKSARREFEETRESRWQVRSMGIFLQEQGKLDDFRSWSDQEQKRQHEELAKQEADAKAAEQQAREERAATYQQKKQEEHEAAAKQMELALQQQQWQQQQQPASGGGGSSSSGSYDNESYWGSPYGWYGGYYGYYNSNAYRGYVRDKTQDAYQRWKGNQPRPTPMQRPAYRGGGGMRGGGRR